MEPNPIDPRKVDFVGPAAKGQGATGLASDDYKLVVLDEISYPMNWGWFETSDVVRAVSEREVKTNVVLTG